MARQRSGQAGLDVTWLCASVFDLPLETASVDLVTDRGLLHHVPTEDHAAYATEIARVLRPGGRLLVRGMSEEGRKKVPVTEASLRRAFDTDDLVVEFVADLRMLHADGSDPATLAVVVRR